KPSLTGMGVDSLHCSSRKGVPMAHVLPALPYSFDALEPYIDRQTMELHHDKHHATYVTKLNEALQPYPQFAAMPIDTLLAQLDRVPDPIRKAVRNNGGGHANHSLFWQEMTPNAGGPPKGEIGDGIKASFGSFDTFKEQFSKTALDVFGSGWVWLIEDAN